MGTKRDRNGFGMREENFEFPLCVLSIFRSFLSLIPPFPSLHPLPPSSQSLPLVFTFCPNSLPAIFFSHPVVLKTIESCSTRATRSTLTSILFSGRKTRSQAVAKIADVLPHSTFVGHVTSSVTWPFDIPHAISYWWSHRTKPSNGFRDIQLRM